MKSESFVYDLKTKIDLKKLKSLPYFNYAEGNQEVLETKVHDLKLKLLPNGKLIVFKPEADFQQLKDELVLNGVEIYSIIEDIKKKLNLKISAKDIISQGKREEIGFIDSNLRKKLGTQFSLDVTRYLFYSIYDVSGDFQAERIATQAGETIARRIVKEKKPTTKQELIKLIKNSLLQMKVGLVEEINPPTRTATLETVLRIKEEAFTVGVPPFNKKVANFSRGFIRGAFAEFKRMESITVNQTKGWEVGDSYTEFEVYSLAR